MARLRHREEAHIQPYLEQLLTVSFVRKLNITQLDARSAVDAIIILTLPAGRQRFDVELKTSYLSKEQLAHLIARRPRVTAPLLLMAPLVSAAAGRVLRDAGVSYVDLAGNLHLQVGNRYVATREGRSRRTAAQKKSLRAPGYQVLFTLLARPELLGDSIRAIATAAGVSTRPVYDLLHRLDTERFIVNSRQRSWNEPRRYELFERWVAGYADTLRPSLWLGSYRTQPGKLEALQRSEPRTENPFKWKWGGASAGYELSKYFRGTRATIHVVSAEPIVSALGALPAADGNLELLKFVGPVSQEGPLPTVVHPLLAATEMLISSDEREREAGRELLPSLGLQESR